MPSKKQDGPNWWQMMLVNAVGTFGATFLAGVGSGQKATEAALTGGAAALVSAGFGRVQANYNPDGGSASKRFDKNLQRSVEN